MPKGQFLGELEIVILLSIGRLRSNAYGTTIRRALLDKCNRDISVGALYTTLERMEDKGFVESSVGEPSPERGGRAKRYYKITGSGERALEESLSMMRRLGANLAPATARLQGC